MPATNPASFFSRLLAWLLDLIIAFLLYVLFNALVMGVNPLAMLSASSTAELQQISQTQTQKSQSLAQSPLKFGSLVVVLAYYLIFWVHLGGATLGKKLMGLKIVGVKQEKVNYLQAIVRFFASFLSFALLLLGFLWMLWDKNKQTWHDKLAKTQVVKVGKSRVLIVIIFILAGVLAFPALMIGGFIKSMNIAKKEMAELAKDPHYYPSFATSEYQKQLSETGEPYWREAKDLFAQMQQADTETVKELNQQQIAALHKALETDGDNPMIWAQLGHAHTWALPQGATLEDGLEAYQKAAELDPQNVSFGAYVGNMFRKLKRYDEAIAQYQTALEMAPEYGDAFAGLAYTYHNLGQLDQAKEYYQKALGSYEKYNDQGIYDAKIQAVEKELAKLN